VAIGVPNPVAAELWLAVNAAHYGGVGGTRAPHPGAAPVSSLRLSQIAEQGLLLLDLGFGG